MGSFRPSSGFTKSLFGVLSLLGLLWLSLISVLETGSNTMAVTPQQGESLKPKVELTKGREKVVVLNMSKRKVPNGPDPIHNRRAGNSRQPPGRV